MGSEKLDKSSSTSGSDHAQKLHESLEQYEKEQQAPKRPKLVLAAVISLFCASAFGIILAGVTLARPVDITAACIARDLILFASVISWFYIGLHIRAARRDVYRLHPGPPQLHGEYLHATALLVARLAICIWVAALIAVSAMVAMAAPARGMEGAMPYLSLMICIGALPAFIVIAATIETTTVPFATACVSKPSLLTCRVSDFADDLVADESVSRRASLARARSGGLTPTTMMNTLGFRTGVVTPAAKPAVTAKVSSEPRNGVTQGTATPETPLVTPPPTYNPGGWRNEFNPVNNAAAEPSSETVTPATASPAVTSPATETPPESGATTPSSSHYTNSGPPSSYFTNTGFSSNKRPRIGPRGTFSRPSLVGRNSSSFMGNGFASPMPAPRSDDMASSVSLPPMHARPAGARAFTGPPSAMRPPTGRAYTSTLGMPQPSKLSTVQYAEDTHLTIPALERVAQSPTRSSPSSRRSPPPNRRYSAGGHGTPRIEQVAAMTPAIVVAPTGPRPLPGTEAAPRAPSPPKHTTSPMTAPMPGGLPSPYWVLRKAQNAQRSSSSLASTSSSATSQPQYTAAPIPPIRPVPAPYVEDVPDEGEPSR